jgi:hypothetical protein
VNNTLANLRRWAAINKDMIKVKGFAVRIEQAAKKGASHSKNDPKLNLSHSMLVRILTEDLEQQREPNEEILPFILQVAQEWNYNPETNYFKLKP